MIKLGDNMKGSFFLKIGFVFIISSMIIYGVKYGGKYFDDFNNDYLLSRIVVEKVDDTYKIYNEGINKYKDDMTTFYGSLDFYYDNFIRKNRAMTTYLAEVEKDIAYLEGPALTLYENCNYDIDDEETKAMCENYKTNLKGVIDSYNKLVVDYNEVLDSFNGFAESNNRAGDVVPNYESVMSKKILKIYDELNN